MGLGGRAQVGLGDDFGERRAAAVVVDVAAAVGIRETLVQIFGGVFFEVQAGDADSLARAVVIDFEPAGQGQRQLVHGNLVALGQIGIEIVFAGEAGVFLHAAD